jgi:hypothetical protein
MRGLTRQMPRRKIPPRPSGACSQGKDSESFPVYERSGAWRPAITPSAGTAAFPAAALTALRPAAHDFLNKNEM